jgi:hypothetical protein
MMLSRRDLLAGSLMLSTGALAAGIARADSWP